MKTKAEVRRDNLRIVINEEFDGVLKNLAAAIEKKPSQLSNLVRQKNPHNVGDKMARLIEEKLNKPIGWLDIDIEIGKTADKLTIDEAQEVNYLRASIAELDQFSEATRHTTASKQFTLTAHNLLREVRAKCVKMIDDVADAYTSEMIHRLYQWYELNSSNSLIPFDDYNVELSDPPPVGGVMLRRIRKGDAERLFYISSGDDHLEVIELLMPLAPVGVRAMYLNTLRHNNIPIHQAYAITLDDIDTFFYVPPDKSLLGLLGEFLEEERAIKLARKIVNYDNLHSLEVTLIKEAKSLYEYIISPPLP